MRVETMHDIVELMYAKGEIAGGRPVVVLLWHEGNQREFIDLSVLGHINCAYWLTLVMLRVVLFLF